MAASLDPDVAHCFVGDDGYIIRVRVPQGCQNGCPIYRMSQLADEREVLFQPYTAFHVKRWQPEGDITYIDCDVLDNQCVSNAKEFGAEAAADMGLPEGIDWNRSSFAAVFCPPPRRPAEGPPS